MLPLPPSPTMPTAHPPSFSQGDRDRFVHAVDQTIRTVSFDQDSTVQVFEVTIRAMGGLLSAHLIAKSGEFGMRIDDYDDELLWLARDLGVRLLPAFDASPTGIPHPRVNLRHGVPKGWRTDTCTAGAGSLLIEFGVLSRLTKDPVFEAVARRATMAIWERRDNTTGLLGSTIDAKTGMWIDKTASMGAGVDSYYEYLFKAFILFGDHTYCTETRTPYLSPLPSLSSSCWPHHRLSDPHDAIQSLSVNQPRRTS